MGLELFKCVPLSVKLTRSSCAKRHREAVPTAGTRGVQRPISPVCRECPIGAAHAKGETPASWPSGDVLELVAFGDLSVAPPPLVQVRTKIEMKRQPKPRANAGSSAEERPGPNREAAGSTPARRVQPTAAQVPEHGARSALIHRVPDPPGELQSVASSEGPMAKRRNGAEKLITYKGETKNLSEWGAKLGMTGAAVKARISRGWTEAEAVGTLLGELPASLEARRAKAPKPPKPKKAVGRPKKDAVDPVAPVERATAPAAYLALDPAALISDLGFETKAHPSAAEGAWNVLLWRRPAA